jgi:mRNA-degrading endonuclease RelE of RelBE toxin-antitoxin system
VDFAGQKRLLRNYNHQKPDLLKETNSMEGSSKKRSWGLLRSQEYTEAYDRLPSKYRSQISRKTHDLMSNPKPGGSRTTLSGYERLCRVRAGDFRIIYAYDEKVVQLLTLRRRDESTYDKLDELEIQQLHEFQGISGSGRGPKIADWEELAKKRAEPRPKPVESLPQPITTSMLDGLDVPVEYRAALLSLTTANDLLESDAVPYEYRLAVLEFICPTRTKATTQEPIAVVEFADLVDPAAAVISGPIDAADSNDLNVPEEDVGSSERRRETKAKSGLPVRFKPPVPLVVIATRQQEPMKPYRGNTSKGIGKDTRYTVKLDGTVQLVYSVGSNERALLTTDEHPELVALVNEAKRRGGSSQGGGGFLINEYRLVLVPTQSGEVLYAGVYTRDLEFTFEKTLISPVAPPSIRPGDIWPGPHVGIKYTLAAGAKDVRYDEETARGTMRRVCLSEFHSNGDLSGLLSMLRTAKPNGGAVYVNEARELFAPVDDGKGYKRRYLGHLGGRPWFPDPS